MSKRKKKNAITLAALLLATIVLIIFYIWYSNHDKASPEQGGRDTEQGTDQGLEELTPAVKLELAALDITLVNRLHIINKEADLKLFLEDTVWKYEADPERPMNQDMVKKILNLAASVKADRLIMEKPENPAEYGLSEPAIYFEAVQSDGKTLRLNIGDKAIGAEGYYAQVGDSETVYLLDTSYGTNLAYSDAEMTAVEAAPVITSENIYHILVEKNEGENFELLYDTENTIDDTGSGLFPWVILQPYEEGYAADSSKVSELLANYSKFKFLQCVDYAGQEPEKYGLEEPQASVYVGYYEYYTMTLDKPETNPNTGEEITEKTYYDDKSFKIYIGSSDGAGNYYARREGSSSVYTIKAEEIDKMLQTNPFSLLSSFITIPNIESVNIIDIMIDGKDYRMEIKRQTSKNEAGEDVKQATYYFNGNTVAESVFKDVYQVMIAAGYDAQVKETVTEADFTPYLTITYHLTGDITLTASYMPYNESFYIVKTQNNPIRFFTDKREIDEIITVIREFKGSAD